MNDTVLRHIIAFVAALVSLLCFFAGYVAGSHGWWWVSFGVLVIYGAMYKIVDVGGHGH